MYGQTQFTETQKRLNEEFIKKVIQEAGSREAAVQRAIKLAWSYFYKNDQQTAMKRFNHAWLLDPNDAEAFYGFGFLTSIQGKTDEAISFYKKTLEINPNHPMALVNLGRSYKDKAYSLYRNKRLKYPDEEVKKVLNEALILYEKASRAIIADTGSGLRMTDSNSELSYIYYEWAIALEFNGDYAKSWEKIKLSRKHGGDRIIEPGFIKELSRFLPEPKD